MAHQPGSRGLTPERAARLARLTDECRQLLTDRGMEAVQQHLSQQGVIDSILVTRKLLGSQPDHLGQAKNIVLSSPSRSNERHAHEALIDDLLAAANELGAHKP